MQIKLPPKPTHVCVDETHGPVIGTDCQTGKPIHAGKWEPVQTKLEVGDRFTLPGGTGRSFRVHRIHGKTVFYVPYFYGHHFPKGTLRRTTRDRITKIASAQ